jgi:hypothetical protein
MQSKLNPRDQDALHSQNQRSDANDSPAEGISEHDRVVPKSRSRWLWRFLFLIVALALIAGILYIFVTDVRPFYKSALQIPKANLEKGSTEFLNRTSKFFNDIRRPGKWSTVWTDEQINGWLAIDQAMNHPHALPSNVHDPRIHFQKDLFSLGVTVDQEPFPVVASFDASLRVTGESKIAIRITTVRVGSLPYGIDRLVQDLIQNIRQRGWGAEHSTIDGDPVILLTLPPDTVNEKVNIIFETVEIHDGELFLAGRTEKL